MSGDAPLPEILLAEIRDLQREQLEAYREMAARSIALQQSAVATQERAVRLYRRVVMVTGVVLVLLVAVAALALALRVF